MLSKVSESTIIPGLGNKATNSPVPANESQATNKYENAVKLLLTVTLK